MSIINKKIQIASLIMMASVFLSRIIGLLREVVIAYIGGIGAGVDAYQIAFVIPEILNHIVASGFLSVTFIPIFSRYIAKDQEEEAWKIFSVILTTFGTILLAFITLTIILSPFLIDLFAPGLSDPAVRNSAIKMTKIIIPAQFFFFLGGLLMAVQFAKGQFFFPALAPLLYNIGIISGGICLSRICHMEGFSWGVLFGAFAGNFLIQYFGAKKAGMKFYFIFDIKHPELKKYVLLTLPLMLGLTMTFSTEIFLKLFGSFLPEGSIAALNYSLRVMFILVGLFGQAVGTASFPFLTDLVVRNKISEMNILLNETLKKYISIVIPFSILFIVLRHEIIYILFQRGRFDQNATELTSGIMIYMMIGTFAFAAQTVVVRGYYAMQNTIFPTIFGSIAVLLSIPVYIYGLKTMGANGVGLAISLSAIMQVIILFELWSRKNKNSLKKEVYYTFLKIIIFSIPLGIFLEFLKNKCYLFDYYNPFIMAICISIIIGIVFLAIITIIYKYLFKEIDIIKI